MKKYLFFLFALLSFTSAKAQQSGSHKEFDTYAKIYNQATGYDLKAPAGYIDAGHDAFYWSPQSHLNWHYINMYRMRLYSPERDVQIVYPVETYHVSEATQGEKNGVKMYVAAAKQFPIKFSEPDPQTGLQSVITSPEVENYYKKLSGDDVRKWFNADYVYVARFELMKPFDDVYTHAMVVSFHGKERYEVVCFLKSGKRSLCEKVFNDLKGNIKLCDNYKAYITRNLYDAQLEIVDNFGKEKIEKYTKDYNFTTVIPKKQKKYKTHLTLDGGKFVLYDRNHPNYAVSSEAFERLTIITPEFGKSYIHQKSGAEVNISEDLYKQCKEYVERNNEKLIKMKARLSDKLPGRI